MKAQTKNVKPVLHDWFKSGGNLFCLTDDTPFMNLLRSMGREIGVPLTNSLHFSLSPKDFTVERIGKASGKAGSSKLVILLERTLRESGGTLDILGALVAAFPDALFLGVCATPTEPVRMLLLETGCVDVVAKPTDVMTVMAKIAKAVNPEPTEMLARRARRDIDGGNLVSGKRILGGLLRTRPDMAENYLLLGDLFRLEGERDKARTVYGVAIRKDDRFLAPLKRVSDMAVEDGDHGMALKFLERMDSISPLNGARKLEMARIAVRTGDVDKAARYLEQAGRHLDGVPIEEMRAMSVRLAELSENDPALAERNARRSLELKKGKFGPEDAHAFNLLGLSLRRQGRNADAVKEYRKALKIIPESPELWYNAGLAFAENYDRKSAGKAMLKAFDLGLHRTAPPVVCSNMGVMLFSDGEVDKAEECFGTALAMEPDFMPAREGLDRLHAWRAQC